MKDRVFKLLGAISILSFILLACDADEHEEYMDNQCEENERTQIERDIRFDVYVQYQDTMPYYGLITLKVKKVYCDGTEDGNATFTGNGDNDGYWHPNQAARYKFANVFDAAVVDIIIQGPGEQVKKVHEEYYYIDVETQYFGLDAEYHIVLPWDSDEWDKSDMLKHTGS